MAFRFSNWTAWSNRNDLSGINRSGVYLIAEGCNLSGRPSVRDLNQEIIYIGCTPKRCLRRRLNKFDEACKGLGGHPAGRSYFEDSICPDFKNAVDNYCDEHNVKRPQATRVIRRRREFQNRLQDFENIWCERKRRINLAIWVPHNRWRERYPGLSDELRIRFAEAKLQVKFVEQYQDFPKYNNKFG